MCVEEMKGSWFGCVESPSGCDMKDERLRVIWSDLDQNILLIIKVHFIQFARQGGGWTVWQQ